MKQHFRSRSSKAFTMLEMMIVVTVIGILAAMAFPAYVKMQRWARETVTVNNLKQITAATLTWAADHGDKLPSPRYTGNEKNLPYYWKMDTDGEAGVWLNGVVFAQIYMEDAEKAGLTLDQSTEARPDGESKIATAGKHLIGTVFECEASVKAMPEELDWFKHSFAMNGNLMYDEIATFGGSSGVSDPWMTEKALSKFDPAVSMLYIDCIEKNIVMATDIDSLKEAAEKRYEGRMVMVAFVDGHVSKMNPEKYIPDEDPQTDREASLFWRGVLPE
ncbi:MAG: type II secretion system protein [Verrucomicrobiae bacterium]|nr:type II secretion system protein [Verrucomicrobiae bacterium]